MSTHTYTRNIVDDHYDLLYYETPRGYREPNLHEKIAALFPNKSLKMNAYGSNLEVILDPDLTAEEITSLNTLISEHRNDPAIAAGIKNYEPNPLIISFQNNRKPYTDFSNTTPELLTIVPFIGAMQWNPTTLHIVVGGKRLGNGKSAFLEILNQSNAQMIAEFEWDTNEIITLEYELSGLPLTCTPIEIRGHTHNGGKGHLYSLMVCTENK